MLATAHNAPAHCLHCGRTMRSPVQAADTLATALLELDRERLSLPLGASTPLDAQLLDLVAHLDAELAGAHLDCNHPFGLADLHLATATDRL